MCYRAFFFLFARSFKKRYFCIYIINLRARVSRCRKVLRFTLRWKSFKVTFRKFLTKKIKSTVLSPLSATKQALVIVYQIFRLVGDKNYLQIISHQMVLSATKLTALLIYKSRPDNFNDPSGDFISHEEFLLILVQNIVFFCTKECILLYKRLHSFVQEYIKMYRRILKRWRVFAKKPERIGRN